MSIFDIDKPIDSDYLISTGWTKGYGEFYTLRLEISMPSFVFRPKFEWMLSANREEGHIVVVDPAGVGLCCEKRIGIETQTDLMMVIHAFIQEWVGDIPHICKIII